MTTALYKKPLELISADFVAGTVTIKIPPCTMHAVLEGPIYLSLKSESDRDAESLKQQEKAFNRGCALAAKLEKLIPASERGHKKPLTTAQIDAALDGFEGGYSGAVYDLARLVELAHGIAGGGQQ
jgi:hypothetical protein